MELTCDFTCMHIYVGSKVNGNIPVSSRFPVNQLLAFLRDGSFPPQFSKNETDALRRKSKNFIVKDQMLFT